MPEEFVSLSSLTRHVEYEQAVSKLARRYYEEEGCPEGRALTHWIRAEEEIRRLYAAAALAEEDTLRPVQA